MKSFSYSQFIEDLELYLDAINYAEKYWLCTIFVKNRKKKQQNCMLSLWWPIERNARIFGQIALQKWIPHEKCVLSYVLTFSWVQNKLHVLYSPSGRRGGRFVANGEVAILPYLRRRADKKTLHRSYVESYGAMSCDDTVIRTLTIW